MLRHKNLITDFNKKHTTRELLSFKNFIYKGNNCGTFTQEYQNAINK